VVIITTVTAIAARTNATQPPSQPADAPPIVGTTGAHAAMGDRSIRADPGHLGLGALIAHTSEVFEWLISNRYQPRADRPAD
jgi:hypothetical protein